VLVTPWMQVDQQCMALMGDGDGGNKCRCC
jgi:hypothetical protein